MVVAHPDDESIFGGAQLLDGSRWDVICVTGASKASRTRELECAAKRAGVHQLICLAHHDSLNHPLDPTQLSDELSALVSNRHYEQVVTHNPDGEYFHPQHQAVSKAVLRLFPESTYVFCHSDTPLPASVLDAKENLLDAYPSQGGVIHSIKHRYGLDFTQLTGARCLDHIRYEGIIHHSAFESQTHYVPVQQRRPGLAAALVDDILKPQFAPKCIFDDLLGDLYLSRSDLLRALEQALRESPRGQPFLAAWCSEVTSPEDVDTLASSLQMRQQPCAEISQFGTLPRVQTPSGRRHPNVRIWIH